MIITYLCPTFVLHLERSCIFWSCCWCLIWSSAWCCFAQCPQSHFWEWNSLQLKLSFTRLLQQGIFFYLLEQPLFEQSGKNKIKSFCVCQGTWSKALSVLGTLQWGMNIVSLEERGRSPNGAASDIDSWRLCEFEKWRERDGSFCVFLKSELSVSIKRQYWDRNKAFNIREKKFLCDNSPFKSI